MALTYSLLFLMGLILGLVVWRLEKKNKRFKNISRKSIKALLVISILVLIAGYGIAYADLVIIGMYVFIPTVAVFLVRRTFLYIQAKS